MIRILQVVTHMNRGGLETMLMNYYRHIDREKIQFDFLVHRQERAAYDDEIESLGGIIYRLPVLNPFSSVYKSTLEKFFEEHSEYTIIHVHQDCMSSVVLKIAMKCKVPIRIAHSHCASQDKNLKYPIKLYYKSKIKKYATHLFACGSEAGKWMFNGADFEVLNNAIDTSIYQYDIYKRKSMRERYAIDTNVVVIGHVGRFNYQKNHDFLIDIFEELCKKQEARLVLIGDGILQEKIKDKVNQKNLDSKVIFAGVKNNVADYLQMMDVFVFPSKYEGLPVTLIEAQATGLPCVVSNRISAECIKTDLVEQISLEDNLKKWVETILKIGIKERQGQFNKIKETGYDIKENVKVLQNFYENAKTGKGKICLY